MSEDDGTGAPHRRAPQPLIQEDRRLLTAIDGVFESAARRAGEHLLCGAGCTPCCIGPFPITALDAWRLQEGLRELRERDPERAGAVTARARAASEILSQDFPGESSEGTLDGSDERRLDDFFARHASAACPVLDPATGRCDLYASRPIPCRIFGPPLLYGEEKAPPCSLCFREASTAEIERSRVEPDPEGIEDGALARHWRGKDAERETLIAFAVTDRFSRPPAPSSPEPSRP